MKTFLLEIISRDGFIFKGEVESLVVPSYFGKMGILANHDLLLAELLSGELKIRKDGETKQFPINGGFLEVKKNRVIAIV